MIDIAHQRFQESVARREQLQKWLDWLMGIAGRFTQTWGLVFLLIGVGGIWGWFGGINTPPAVVCLSQTDLCYRLRIWGVKTAVDTSSSHCKKSRRGFTCLVPDSLKKAP